MTSIVTTNAAMFSPKQHLLDSIAAQVKSGSIGSADQTALDRAVNDIDRSLATDRTSGAGSSSRQLDPSQMKSRIDDLIASEVTKGTLTSDQAETLKQVLAQGGGDGGTGGPGAPAGAGGPPPGPPPEAGSDDSSSPSPTGSTASSASDLLTSFLQQLQASQSQTSGYAAIGQTGSSKLVSALLLNFEA